MAIPVCINRKTLAAQIHRDIPESFYCGCPRWQGSKGLPDLEVCGYQIRKNKIRAERIEWEHIMPAYHFGSHRLCWKKGGRKNCATDAIYVEIEADLHNLQPVIGEINGDRSNHPFRQWQGTNSQYGQYGQYEMKIDFRNKQVEPPIRARGAIVRTYFYMRDRYDLRLSSQQSQLTNLNLYKALYFKPANFNGRFFNLKGVSE